MGYLSHSGLRFCLAVMLWTWLLSFAQTCTTTRSFLPPVGDLTPNAYTIEATIQQGPEDLNPYPYKPKVHFRPDGSFKLLVMSDLHFGENPWDVWGPEQDRKSIILVGRFSSNFGTGDMNEAS